MQAARISLLKPVLAALALLLSFAMGAPQAWAKSVPLDSCTLAATASDTVPSVLSKPQAFSCADTQNQLSPGNYWVKMQAPALAPGDGRNLIFRTASLWDEGFELWTIHSDGHIEHYQPFQKQAISPMRLGATTIVPLRNHPAPISMLLAKVSDSGAVRGVMLQSQISTSESAITFEMIMSVFYAGFAGICIALLVYNIALWRAMREPFLLAYCVMIVATLSYGLFTSGALHYFVSGLSGPDRLRITIPLLAYSASAALIFIRFFFANTEIPSWLVRTTYIQATAMAATATIYAILAPWQIKTLDAIYVYSFTPVPVIFGVYVWKAWKSKDRFLGYFLLGWSGVAFSTFLRMLHAFDIVPYHILIENSTLFGLAFEALVSSLAIGYRVRLLAKARDRAEIAEAHAMAIADTDPLTGLLNRRAFLRALLERHSHWTLVLLDVDHFKRVNDSLGHACGDEALALISETLQEVAPQGALVARLGGEEFAIAYRGNLLLLEPEDLLASVRQINLPQGYRITASIGIANRIVTSEDDWKILYRAADMALYRAKTGGRDRFILIRPQTVAA